MPNCNDPSCCDSIVTGCTDPGASNYDPAATIQGVGALACTYATIADQLQDVAIKGEITDTYYRSQKAACQGRNELAGSTSENHMKTTFEACQAACTVDTRCTGFEWFHDGSMCKLSSSCTTGGSGWKTYSNLDFYAKNQAEAALIVANLPDPKFSFSPGQDGQTCSHANGGGDLGYRTKISPEACQVACAVDPSCVSYTVNLDNNWCNLSSVCDNDGLQGYKGYTTYVKNSAWVGGGNPNMTETYHNSIPEMYSITTGLFRQARPSTNIPMPF